MTFDNLGTSFNTDAISINILQLASENLVQSQMRKLHEFFEESMKMRELAFNFKIFYHNQLVQNQNVDDKFLEALRNFTEFVDGML